MHHMGNVFISICVECANFPSLSVSQHIKKTNFHNIIANSEAAIAKAIIMVYQ